MSADPIPSPENNLPLRQMQGMRLALFAALVVPPLVLSTGVRGQTRDPYASQVENYRQARAGRLYENFLGDVASYYFALGCRVFPSEGMFSSDIVIRHRLFITALRRSYEDIQRDIAKFAEEGRAAGRKGDCTFWSDHPENVVEIRAMADRGNQLGRLPPGSTTEPY